MATDVVMPQMGESIFEGTITKWLKKPGDKVQRDEPLFEISTDKVDAEIPAPAAGVLKEIKVKEGQRNQPRRNLLRQRLLRLHPLPPNLCRRPMAAGSNLQSRKNLLRCRKKRAPLPLGPMVVQAWMW